MRESGIKALNCVLKNQKNCEIIEKKIYSHIGDDYAMYSWCIYQAVGMLLKKDCKEVLVEVKSKKLGWNASIYDNVRERIEEFDGYLEKPFEIVEGVSECGKCGSKKTFSVQKQTRSSDEPMTTFSRCAECGNQWTYSG